MLQIFFCSVQTRSQESRNSKLETKIQEFYRIPFKTIKIRIFKLDLCSRFSLHLPSAQILLQGCRFSVNQCSLVH
ncbi:hypothetical protein KFK09_006581 [Dendrobium nobile]|uniref:Uncharacterized protein n=1 Tax=Dendrobium nobile TaxID=94219 RepID=A0A8T3BU22_DENNO|nr:hypothetical protein KFK09_006581 [Dendrobium nobile]